MDYQAVVKILPRRGTFLGTWLSSQKKNASAIETNYTHVHHQTVIIAGLSFYLLRRFLYERVHRGSGFLLFDAEEV